MSVVDRLLSTRRRARDLRGDTGMGLVEVLVAMFVLSVAVAGLLAAFVSSIVSITHTGEEGTAITLADRQMESYRSLPFSCIPSTLSGTAPTGCPSFSGFPNPYSASQSVSGSAAPDHRAYTVTTTLAVSGSQKQITVSVSGQTSGTTLARQSSYFSASGSS